MKNCLLTGIFCLWIVSAFSQNVGIGTAIPLEKLHVAGSMRSDMLASPDSNLVLSDVNGKLINMAAGSSGQVLMSQGNGRRPAWGNLSGTTTVQTFNVTATRTFVGTTYPTWTQVGGLSQTITLTAPSSTLLITTYGSLETTSSAWGASGCMVQLFQNGSPISSAFQTIDVMDAIGFTNKIEPWSFSAYLTLGPGTYTFSIMSTKYGFDDFYAGGNFTAPNPDEGALTITVIN